MDCVTTRGLWKQLQEALCVDVTGLGAQLALFISTSARWDGSHS